MGAEKKKKKTSIVDSIIASVIANPTVFLWHSGQEAYATISGQHYLVGSTAFHRWVATTLYRVGVKVKPTDFKTALPIIEAGCLSGDDSHIHRRIARHNGSIYIDLGERFVEVTASGWQIVDTVPVKFVGDTNFGSLPIPGPGSLDSMRDIVHVDDDNWTLIKGWCLDCVKGHGPYRILIVNGPAGSAKSSLCRTLKAVLDPVINCPLLGVPRDEEGFASYCNHDFVLAYDNVSRLAEWQSDILCRVATGAGFRKRKLYTDDEQLQVSAARPQILNGIPEFAEASDLHSRALLIATQELTTYRTERELAETFQRLLPGVLGGLFDMVSAGLRANVAPMAQDRMADSAAWIKGCGLEDWETVCSENREVADDIALATSPIADLIIRFVTCPLLGGGEVKLRPSDLLERLKSFAQETGIEVDAKLFPRSGKALSDRLMRDKQVLARNGIGVDRKRTNTTRYIWLRPLVRAASPAAMSASPSDGPASPASPTKP